jgi:hypothetical protein
MTPQSKSTGSPVTWFGSFAFTARALRNAIRRDRQALAVGQVSHALPCGVRQLARIERWLEGATTAGGEAAQVPTGPAAAAFGLGPATARWFLRLVREGRYCRARCRGCRRDYTKGQLQRRTRSWPGIRIRGHGPTGARWERWLCCPRGHRIMQLGFRVS